MLNLPLGESAREDAEGLGDAQQLVTSDSAPRVTHGVLGTTGLHVLSHPPRRTPRGQQPSLHARGPPRGPCSSLHPPAPSAHPEVGLRYAGYPLPSPAPPVSPRDRWEVLTSKLASLKPFATEFKTSSVRAGLPRTFTRTGFTASRAATPTSGPGHRQATAQCLQNANPRLQIEETRKGKRVLGWESK